MPTSSPFPQPDRIDVACPGCGDVYHLRPDTRSWQCRNPDCRKNFPVSAVDDLSPPPVREDLYRDGDAVTETDRETDSETHRDAPASPPSAGQPIVAVPLGEPEPTTDQPFSQANVSRQTGDSDNGDSDNGDRDRDDAVPADDIPELPIDAIVAKPLDANPLDAGDSPPPPVDTAIVARPLSDDDISPQTTDVNHATRQVIDDRNASVAPARSSPTQSAIDGGTKTAQPQKVRTELTDKQRRERTVRRVLVAAIVLCLATAGVWWRYRPRPNPEKDWESAQQIFQDKRWTPAEKAFAEFADEFPDHSKSVFVPFFVDLCGAGNDIYSSTADLQAGWQALQEIFERYRDHPVYNSYKADLYFAAKQLADSFLQRAEAAWSLPDVALAREAFALQDTVAQSMDDSFVPDQLKAFTERVVVVEQKIELELARREAKENLEIAISIEPGINADLIYATDDRLCARFPELAEDRELQQLRKQAYQAESQRVNYVAENEFASAQPASFSPASSSGVGASTFVVWGEPREREFQPGPPEIVLALARGVLYAFNEHGQLLWAQRLGIDAHELPEVVPATDTQPETLIAVSTLENALLALDPLTGRVRWRYQPDTEQYLSTPPAIVPVRGGLLGGGVKLPAAGPAIRRVLQPAGHEIHVLEPALGKRIGRFEVGFPMTARGVFDPRTELVYFPADSNRIFALNPNVIDDRDSSQPPCPSMLFTHHPSGGMRSQPVVVGPYLILSESGALESMSVRAFPLHAATDTSRPAGFVDPELEPAQQLEMRGWSWFRPAATPDRISIVTDAGELGVFGLNLDNRAEALYPLIQDNGGQTTKLPVNDPFRALAVYSEEHLLWVMVGGRLRLFFLDVLRQQIRPIEAAGDAAKLVRGVPLHRAQLDRAGNVFFLATMALNGTEDSFSAVNIESGELHWQRKLGLNLAVDPIVMEKGILLIDRSGRMLGIGKDQLAAQDGRPQRIQRPAQNQLPKGASAEQLIRLPAPDGGFFLLAATNGGKRLAIRRFDDQAVAHAGWTTCDLPSKLRGKPAVFGNFLLVPGEDGVLYTLRCQGDRQSDDILPFPMERGDRRETTGVRIAVLPGELVCLIDGPRLRWLELHSEAGIRQWKDTRQPLICAASILGEPQRVDGHLIVLDHAGFVYTRPVDGGHAGLVPPWRLTDKSLSEPFLVGDRVFVIADRRVLLCFGSGDQGEPMWTSEPFPGRICGRPAKRDDRLLVTDTGGNVTALDRRDGKLLWRQSLSVDVGPAAAAVPIDRDRVLVPLTDGTLFDMQVQTETERVARSAE